MCGIIAQTGVQTDSKRQAAALAALNHRGPDGNGTWKNFDHSVWLGHQRLSIVDLSNAGAQPMANESKTVCLVCNGEIYNYPHLRQQLESLGHCFSSNCDNEVLVHAYEEWAEDLLQHLEGMFAFVIWDEHKQQLLAARDRVGIKPLYYAETKGGLVVASEAGALLYLMDPRPEIDPQALAYVLTLGYVPAPLSIWRGIRKLEAGHILRWNAGDGVSLRKYWEPPRELKNGSVDPDDWPTILETVLREHLMADVPIGLFLSGGLDSSTLAAGLAANGTPTEAITINFPGSSLDESNTAKVTADRLGISLRKETLEITDVDGLLRRVTAAADEPQGYGGLLPMYRASEAASKDYKVVLSGDGGDEVFGGYSWYQDLNGGGRVSEKLTRQALRPFVRRNASPRLRARAMDAFSASSPLHRHAWRLFPRFLPEEVEALLAPMGVRFGDEELLTPLKKHFEPTLPLKRALQRIDLMTFNSDSVLPKVDRMSMAHSLEVRVPLLDRRIVEWGLSQPSDPKESKESKPVLRQYLRGRVPDSVLRQPKRGFSLAVAGTMDWESMIGDIQRGPWVEKGMWSADWERLVEPGVPFREGRIWALLNLTRWAEAR